MAIKRLQRLEGENGKSKVEMRRVKEEMANIMDKSEVEITGSRRNHEHFG